MTQTYKQCTLVSQPTYEIEDHTYFELVEWVPSKIAIVGKIVECNGRTYRIVHVGAENHDPRSSHHCRT